MIGIAIVRNSIPSLFAKVIFTEHCASRVLFVLGINVSTPKDSLKE